MKQRLTWRDVLEGVALVALAASVAWLVARWWG